MDLSELDYSLPPELIAQEPLPRRDASRLLVVDAASGTFEHHRFSEIAELVPPSLFVLNETRVFAARLHGQRPTGGKLELLLLEHKRADEGGQCWEALARPHKALQAGMALSFSDGLQAQVLEKLPQGRVLVSLSAGDADVMETVERVGQVPLPPYIKRAPKTLDRERYQTVVARNVGAVAAPTAGLHFTAGLLERLPAAGHRVAKCTLHVGPGTFQPIQVERLADHEMHEEAFEIDTATAAAVAAAREDHKAVVAVGTTVVRTLESNADEQRGVRAGRGRTRLFIHPPHAFHVVDHLITNFHLPRSSLLALVMAFASPALIQEAYREAVRERYRFYSYGDAMLIRGARP